MKNIAHICTENKSRSSDTEIPRQQENTANDEEVRPRKTLHETMSEIEKHYTPRIASQVQSFINQKSQQ